MIVPNYPNYEIFRDGRVINRKTGRTLKHTIRKDGYYIVSLNTKSKLLHRLLGVCFISNPNNLPVIDHINRNTRDNRLENLRWATYKTNSVNSKVKNTNKLNEKHISINKRNKNKKYRFTITINGKQNSKCFYTLQEAIIYRDIII